MKKLIYPFLLLIGFIGCKPGIPKDIIEPAEMEKVLYDIHLVEGYVNSIPYPDSAKKIAAGYYKGIYKKYNTDSVQYNKSLDYYYAHPDVFKTMYDHITSRMTKAKDMQVKLEEKELKAAAKADSIKQAKLIQKAKKDSIAKKLTLTDTLKKHVDSLAKKKNNFTKKKKTRKIKRNLIIK